MSESFRFCGHESHIGEVSVRELLTCSPSFQIPSYQRGYRWQGKQVKALLDDLYGKWKDDKSAITPKKYLLQPIVLQGTGKTNEWIVVDGQQRLTTLKILLEELCEKQLAPGLNKEQIWDITPATSQNESERLSDACRHNTRLKIRDYPVARLECIARHLCDIVFIYNRLDGDGESAAEAFERLNAGKIALTDSELIRALYLTENNELARSIAAEWEQIEAILKDDAFWFMFNNRAPDTPTRIDRLFRIVTEQENKDTPHAAFWQIEAGNRSDAEAKERDSLDDVWNRMLNLFWMLRYCYKSISLYHYIGWFCHRTEIQFKYIYTLYECDRLQFKKNLQKIILGQTDKLSSTCNSRITAVFEKVRHLKLSEKSRDSRNQSKMQFMYLYPPEEDDGLPPSVCDKDGNLLITPDKRDIVDFLLMFNLELLNQRTENISRFSFARFNSQTWDIEHVASHNPKFEKNPSEDAIEQYDKNLVGNLALLDRSVNRAYKDKPFREKRRYILGMKQLLDEETGKPLDAFMPPGTLDVFSKNYTEEVKDMGYWYQTDFDAYYARMVKVFTNMWNEAFPESLRS